MNPDSRLGSALFVPNLPFLLTTRDGEDHAEDAWTLGRWFSGGMNTPFTDRERMLTWVPGLTEEMYRELLLKFGWEETAPLRIRDQIPERDELPPIVPRRRETRKEGLFSLPGRLEVETFFRERILDVIDREEEYRRMGIPFPGPTLLVGPPGCGKTHAVEKLIEWLGWPSYTVGAATIASSYIHETSRLIARLFEQAMDDAPSVIVMDEMEAYLSSRSGGMGYGGQAHTEEMAEFLRLLPQLPGKKVLLFGMTNLPEQIDPAIMRKGRFDHVIEMDFPSVEEICALLTDLLKEVPKEADINWKALAVRLRNRPISDVVYVAREAGRLAVVRKRSRVDQELLEDACEDLIRQNQGKQSKRSIGFR